MPPISFAGSVQASDTVMAVLLTRLSLLQEFGRHAVGLLQGASREYPEPPGGTSRAGRIPTRDLPASPAAVQSFEQAFRAFGGAQSFEELESLGQTTLTELMLLGTTTVQLSAITLAMHISVFILGCSHRAVKSPS